MSPKHCYFCTSNNSPDLTPFFIPFTEVMHLVVRKKKVRPPGKIFKFEGVIEVYGPFGNKLSVGAAVHN